MIAKDRQGRALARMARASGSEAAAEPANSERPQHRAHPTDAADRAWVRWGSSADDLPNRIDLELGVVIHTPA
jgi:hypothetical protein